MTTDTLFPNDEPLRFKIIRPVYETLTVNDNAAEYFEPSCRTTAQAFGHYLLVHSWYTWGQKTTIMDK